MKQSMYHYIYSCNTVLTITHRKLLVSGNSIGHKWGIFCPTGLRPEGRGMTQRAERLFKWSYVCQTKQVFKVKQLTATHWGVTAPKSHSNVLYCVIAELSYNSFLSTGQLSTGQLSTGQLSSGQLSSAQTNLQHGGTHSSQIQILLSTSTDRIFSRYTASWPYFTS